MTPGDIETEIGVACHHLGQRHVRRYRASRLDRRHQLDTIGSTQ